MKPTTRERLEIAAEDLNTAQATLDAGRHLEGRNVDAQRGDHAHGSARPVLLAMAAHALRVSTASCWSQGSKEAAILAALLPQQLEEQVVGVPHAVIDLTRFAVFELVEVGRSRPSRPRIGQRKPLQA